MQIIDGKKVRDEILQEIKKEVGLLSFAPVFCDILVGDDKVSMQYVAIKQKTAESLGIKFHTANFSEDITTEDLVLEINKLNKEENMCGLIVQLPLPSHIDKKIILDAIDPLLDVDCLGSFASERFYKGNQTIGFPAALACAKLLSLVPISGLKDKKIVVLGKGDLVGKPVSVLLLSQNFNVETLDRQSENKEEIIKNADVIISGMGQGKYIKGDMLKNGVVIIDAGNSESNNSIVGDVDMDSVKDVASYISPVPGGVGPVTVAMLFVNVLNVAKSFKRK